MVVNDNRAILAKNLRHYIERSGKDRRELADIWGFPYSTVSEWISGKKYPRIDRIEIMANYFGITKSDLIEGATDTESSVKYRVLGARLRDALHLKNMRASDLCQKTGIPKGAISYYLSGKSEPKADRLYIICKALDVSEAWMLGYDVPMERQPEQKNNDAIADIIVRLRTDAKFFKTVSALYGLDSDQLDSLAQLLQALTK